MVMVRDIVAESFRKSVCALVARTGVVTGGGVGEVVLQVLNDLLGWLVGGGVRPRRDLVGMYGLSGADVDEVEMVPAAGGVDEVGDGGEWIGGCGVDGGDGGREGYPVIRI